jgi:serine/threonine-protein kinase/endoribonuclease IRE1
MLKAIEETSLMIDIDYTLTIHLRGRPTLSQTLRFSTFAPNTADRDISALWSREGLSSDHRAVMGMPDEGTVVCFDAKSQASKQRDKDNTLWISELGATAAGIFDVVYPAPHISKQPRPIIVPHPTIPLRSLFPSAPMSTILPGSGSSGEGTMQPKEQTTLLGIANGHLYAMGSDHFPLVSFSPRAPAGQDVDDSHAHHEHVQHGTTSTCTSFGCLLGTYDLQSHADHGLGSESMFDFDVGHAPLLGIGDGREDERRRSEEPASPASSEGPASIPAAAETTTASSKEPKVSTSPWTWNPSPMMVMVQIVALLLLAVLCGLIYVGAQELQRQRSEDAKTVSKDIVWVPRVADVKEEPDEVKEAPIVARDPEEVAQELLAEEEAEAAIAEKEKKKPAK